VAQRGIQALLHTIQCGRGVQQIIGRSERCGRADRLTTVIVVRPSPMDEVRPRDLIHHLAERADSAEHVAENPISVGRVRDGAGGWRAPGRAARQTLRLNRSADHRTSASEGLLGRG